MISNDCDEPMYDCNKVKRKDRYSPAECFVEEASAEIFPTQYKIPQNNSHCTLSKPISVRKQYYIDD